MYIAIIQRGVLMNLRTIIEVCKTRERHKMDCRRCKYSGRTCEHTCDILKVGRPSEYNLEKLNNKRKRGN